MTRKWKVRWPMYKILVVADEDGTAKYYPFVKDSNHEGEDFWVGGEKFKVESDGGIHFDKKFMEVYGHTRSDGKRALILEAYGQWYPERYDEHAPRSDLRVNYKKLNVWLETLAPVDPVKKQRYVQGARIWYCTPPEKYYMGKNDDILLIEPRLCRHLRFVHPLYENAQRRGGWVWTYDLNHYPGWYHPQDLVSFQE